MNGLLIDYKWCTGCHACEVACQQEHGFAPKELFDKGKFGIKIHEIGPYEIEEGKYQYEFLPIPTQLCDLCADRVKKEKVPTCVKHCQTACIAYGPVGELAKRMDSKEMTLFV